jgi:predicted N-formylglutamate amidohydrolase
MTMEAFEYVRPETWSEAPVIFVCDHASSLLPKPYGTLGLDASLFNTHIARDIGAAEVTRALAAAFGAPAILARWSRLLVDLNRGADDPTLVAKLSDGAIIPGNASADASEIERRIAEFHVPYHDAIAAVIERSRAHRQVPVLISMHSFTPIWKGKERPWQFGILWDRDSRLAKPLIAALRAAGFSVGDNEPYSGELENDCMHRHGTANGLPHVLIEIRQDLVATQADAAALAARLQPIVADALARMGKSAVRFTRPLPAKGTKMDETTRTELEAAVFRRLVAHLRERNDVQNIDLMILAGFCRNCLGDWYREVAAEQGISLDKDEAREIVYGMPLPEWKKRYQKEATPEQQQAFERSQRIHK